MRTGASSADIADRAKDDLNHPTAEQLHASHRGAYFHDRRLTRRVEKLLAFSAVTTRSSFDVSSTSARCDDPPRAQLLPNVRVA